MMVTKHITFSENAIRFMREKRWTQRELAMYCGSTPIAISHVVMGHEPGPELAQKIARALGCDLKDLGYDLEAAYAKQLESLGRVAALLKHEDPGPLEELQNAAAGKLTAAALARIGKRSK